MGGEGGVSDFVKGAILFLHSLFCSTISAGADGGTRSWVCARLTLRSGPHQHQKNSLHVGGGNNRTNNLIAVVVLRCNPKYVPFDLHNHQNSVHFYRLYTEYRGCHNVTFPPTSEARVAPGSQVHVYRDWCTVHMYSSTDGPSKVCLLQNAVSRSILLR